jgi:inosine-uridine nucleoside N-ribohydrolase
VSERPAIVLDCDPGLDDAVAILTAAKYGDLLGITTVRGNSSVDNTTRNALAVVELAGLDVPVHKGAASPLVVPCDDASHIHGETGLGASKVTARGAHASDDAAGWLIDLTRRRGDVHLVAVGPLTNVALAMRRDPGFASRLASLTIMGGGARRGNVTPAAEFNIWADPEAAAVVFTGGVTVRMVPLDLTLEVLMTPDHLQQLRASGSATAEFIADLVDYYAEQQRRHGSERVGAVHDPCAVLSRTHAHLFELTERHVDIELAGTHTRGMTVVDERNRPRSGPPNAEVAYRARADDVLSLIVDAAIDPS